MAIDRYQIKLLPEVRAILHTDFEQIPQRTIIKELYNELSFMPNRYPAKTSRRDGKTYKTIQIEGYAWAFIIKDHLVTVVYGAQNWRF